MATESDEDELSDLEISDQVRDVDTSQQGGILLSRAAIGSFSGSVVRVVYSIVSWLGHLSLGIAPEPVRDSRERALLRYPAERTEACKVPQTCKPRAERCVSKTLADGSYFLALIRIGGHPKVAISPTSRLERDAQGRAIYLPLGYCASSIAAPKDCLL